MSGRAALALSVWLGYCSEMKLCSGILALLLGVPPLFLSCGLFESNVAELYTDVPEMAFYADEFNASQDRYKIHVRFDERLASTLGELPRKPALAVGRYLKSSDARPYFQSLDYLFSELIINQSAFYPALLELGNIEGRQLLLPISFNLPLVIFAKEREAGLSNNFTISLEELEKKGAEYNQTARGSWSKLGFGTRWSPEFLYAALRLYGADFRESAPLRWNKSALDQGLASLRAWTDRANGSALKEEEFQFKYLYLPSYKSVLDGRIGFASIDSSSYFVITEERRSALSFRWLAKDESIPVSDDIVYAGICRRAQGKAAAEAFLKWFYAEETQRNLLEEAKSFHSAESSFGLAGGFSAIRSVNEKHFPLFYPSLLGRLPPAKYLAAPPILPSIWPDLKGEVLLPFLLEATGTKPPKDAGDALEARIQAWIKRRSSP